MRSSQYTKKGFVACLWYIHHRTFLGIAIRRVNKDMGQRRQYQCLWNSVELGTLVMTRRFANLLQEVGQALLACRPQLQLSFASNMQYGPVT
jgi:hypothetical protein